MRHALRRVIRSNLVLLAANVAYLAGGLAALGTYWSITQAAWLAAFGFAAVAAGGFGCWWRWTAVAWRIRLELLNEREEE